jgi:hypothetical protein
MRRLSLLGALALCACATAVEPPAAARPETVQVMVLGSFHFAGSESDLITFKVDDILGPKRQAEIAAVVEELARFRPTIVAVERTTDAPEYVDIRYAEFSPKMLAENPNERVQLGYRLAAAAALDRVHGLDESPSEGEPDYFPWMALVAHVEQTGQKEKLDALMARVQSEVGDAAARISEVPIAEGLIVANTELASPEIYYSLAEFDAGEAQPAAELQGYWFMRNAKIFSKLVDVTKPGDRVVLVYGSGHKHWLDHLVERTPGFERVDPIPYLERAAR